MLCDRDGAIGDGSKVYDTCNHLELYKEDLACECLRHCADVADVSDEVLWSQHLPILLGLGSNHTTRRERGPNQRERYRIL